MGCASSKDYASKDSTAAVPAVPSPDVVRKPSGATSDAALGTVGGDDLDWVSLALPGGGPGNIRPRPAGARASSSGMRLQILLDGGWRDSRAEEEKAIMEQLARGKTKFMLQARGQEYHYDFEEVEATQTNTSTGKQRKLRLIDVEDEKLLASAKMSTGSLSEGDAASAALALQLELGPQSKRGGAGQHAYRVLEDHPHAKDCFYRFAANEAKLCGEWACFYHSYSFAALIYEVHAAVGSVLFRFRSQYATLPRILVRDFNETPDAPALATKFTNEFANGKRDHDPRFRKVGISAMLSLCSTGPEACIPMVFVSGYSCKDLSFRGVLENLLESCYVPKKEVKSLADKIIQLSEKHGLDVTQFGGKPCSSGRAGHLLQIFIRRHLVDRLAYAAKPYGPVDTERMPLSAWLDGDKSCMVGQARVVAHPKFFMQANLIRMFVASSDPTFHRNRQSFQEELIQLLGVILGQPQLREKAATGIYGGSLPSWWKAEDQRAKAK